MSMTKKENDDDIEAPVLRPKKKRASYGLDVKLHVIKQKKENGQRVVDIARSLRIPETTIQTILKNSTEIEAKAMTTPRQSEANITRMRSDAMEMMERKLCEWIEDLYLQQTPVSLSLIRTKALSLYDDIQKEISGQKASKKPKEFSASKGWFHRFQKRYDFKSVSVKMQQGPASVDEGPLTTTTTTGNYSENLRNFIDNNEEVGVYDPKRRQTFKNELTGLYGKQINSRTYVSKKKSVEPSFKASKDKLSDDRFLEEVDDDVHRLLSSHSLPLTNEQLALLNQTTNNVERENTSDDTKVSHSNPTKELTVANLRAVFEKIDEVVTFFKEHDHQGDRATKFELGLEELLSCYRTLLTEKFCEEEQVILDPLREHHRPVSDSSDD